LDLPIFYGESSRAANTLFALPLGLVRFQLWYQFFLGKTFAI